MAGLYHLYAGVFLLPEKMQMFLYPDKLLFFTLYITQISSGWTIPFVCRSIPLTRKCRCSQHPGKLEFFTLYNKNFQWLDYTIWMQEFFLLSEKMQIFLYTDKLEFSLYLTNRYFFLTLCPEHQTRKGHGSNSIPSHTKEKTCDPNDLRKFLMEGKALSSKSLKKF